MEIKKIERDENGLVKDMEYFLTEEGLIDWRKMVKPEFLYVKDDHNKEKDVSELADEELVINLKGLKYLAKIRGYRNVLYPVVENSGDRVSIVCSIEWIPNFETEMQPVVFSATADATEASCSSFMKYYLTPAAENRAFARCIRNFLGINIVANEELKDPVSTSGTSGSDISAHQILADLMSQNGIPFQQLKNAMMKEGVKEIEGCESIDKFSSKTAFQAISKIKKVLKEKNKK